MATTTLFGDTGLTREGFQSVLNGLAEQYSVRPLSGQPEAGEVLLRHDVALSLSDAVAMAKTEAELGVRGTYCIMLSSPLFNPMDETQRARIREIDSYGHEIGLLCNTHGHWDREPEAQELSEFVASRQSVLDGIVQSPSDIVSFHRPPSWVQQRSFSEFQNALTPAYTSGISYVADDSRTRGRQYDDWNGSESLHLLIHPTLWMNSAHEYERNVEQSVIEACRYVNRRARAEFVDPQRES